MYGKKLLEILIDRKKIIDDFNLIVTTASNSESENTEKSEVDIFSI